jgi:hypothetical protein
VGAAAGDEYGLEYVFTGALRAPDAGWRVTADFFVVGAAGAG